MDPPAREQRQQFGQQVPDQGDRTGIGGIERHRLPRDAERVDESVARDGQRTVPLVAQPAVHVAQAVLIGHQLHVVIGAEGVQLEDLRRGEGARPLVHLGMIPVGVGVFGVELDLVDLPRCQPDDQGPQGGHRRDLVTGDVQHDPTHPEVGMVPDRADGKRSPVQVGELCECRVTVEGAGRIGTRQFDTRVGDLQHVALWRQRRIEPLARDDTGPRRRSARGSVAPAAGSPEFLSIDEVHFGHHSTDRGIGNDGTDPGDRDLRPTVSTQLVQGAQEHGPAGAPSDEVRSHRDRPQHTPPVHLERAECALTSPPSPASRARTRFPLSAALDTSCSQPGQWVAVHSSISARSADRASA